MARSERSYRLEERIGIQVEGCTTDELKLMFGGILVELRERMTPEEFTRWCKEGPSDEEMARRAKLTQGSKK